MGMVGLLVIAFSLGMMLGERRGRRRESVGGASGAATGDSAREIEAVADRVIRDLERRTTAATQLLDQAEAKIAGLREMLEACEDLGRGGRSDIDPGDAPGDAPPEGEETLGPLDKRKIVFDLADQGLSVPEIARRAGIGRGEAQLILDLRARGGASRGASGGTPTSPTLSPSS